MSTVATSPTTTFRPEPSTMTTDHEEREDLDGGHMTLIEHLAQDNDAT